MTDDNENAELTLETLVNRLGHSAYWWKAEIRAKNHPHIRVGREYRFTEADYIAIRESYRPKTTVESITAGIEQSPRSRARTKR